jgi:phosphatidylglycerol:prolipoprotein diacylglycerol transferase
MSRVLLDLGFIQIYWYSVCILIGMMIGMYLVYKEAARKDVSENLITNLIFYTVIVAIFGARLYYVIFKWDYYSNHLYEILEIWNGGLAIHGAIICGGLYLIYYTKKHKLETLRVLDICCVGLIIGQVCGRWGNFFNQEAYGAEVSLEFLKGLHLPGFIIDGMHIDGAYYHPTFLYESLWCILGFVVLIIYRRKKYVKTGQIFGIYCMWYGLGRFFIEGLRVDSLMFGSLKAAQIVSIGMFLVGVFFFVRRFRSGRFDNLYNESHQVETVLPSQGQPTTFIQHNQPNPVTQPPITPNNPVMQSNVVSQQQPVMQNSPVMQSNVVSQQLPVMQNNPIPQTNTTNQQQPM